MASRSKRKAAVQRFLAGEPVRRPARGKTDEWRAKTTRAPHRFTEKIKRQHARQQRRAAAGRKFPRAIRRATWLNVVQNRRRQAPVGERHGLRAVPETWNTLPRRFQRLGERQPIVKRIDPQGRGHTIRRRQMVMRAWYAINNDETRLANPEPEGHQ
jgi:hypothetical protein